MHFALQWPSGYAGPQRVQLDLASAGRQQLTIDEQSIVLVIGSYEVDRNAFDEPARGYF
jgi:hypothetical protein